MFLNVDNVGAERMSSSRLFPTTGPASRNAQLPNCSLLLGTTESPRAAERRGKRLGTVDNGMHISFRYHGARPWTALYTSRQSLNEMRSLARSQCRWSRSSEVTWWRLSPPNINLTEQLQLSTLCSLSRVWLVHPEVIFRSSSVLKGCVTIIFE